MIILFSLILRNRSHNLDASVLKRECSWVKEPGVCALFGCIPSVYFQILLFLFICMSITCCKWNYPPEKLPRLITRVSFKRVCLCRRLQHGLAELPPEAVVSSPGQRFPPTTPLLSGSGWVTLPRDSILLSHQAIHFYSLTFLRVFC